MTDPLERMRLDPLTRERVELNYVDVLGDVFALHSYTRILRPPDQEARPLVTLYAVPSAPGQRGVGELLSWFDQRGHRHYQPFADSAIVPQRRWSTASGVIAFPADTPEASDRLLAVRATWTFEYVGSFVADAPDEDGRYAIRIWSTCARLVQLAAMLADAGAWLKAAPPWQVWLNVRGADRAVLAQFNSEFNPDMVDFPNRCYERNVQLGTSISPEGDDGWSAARALDLALAHAFGSASMLAHSPGGDLGPPTRRNPLL